MAADARERVRTAVTFNKQAVSVLGKAKCAELEALSVSWSSEHVEEASMRQLPEKPSLLGHSNVV